MGQELLVRQEDKDYYISDVNTDGDVLYCVKEIYKSEFVEDRYMKTYQVSLNGKHYSMLEKMLCSDRAGQLAKNQHINGYELFSDMLHDICSPVTDGWSTFEIILEESVEELDLLRLMTKVVYPENEDYFVGQIGQHFQCEKDFEFQIYLKF